MPSEDDSPSTTPPARGEEIDMRPAPAFSIGPGSEPAILTVGEIELPDGHKVLTPVRKPDDWKASPSGTLESERVIEHLPPTPPAATGLLPFPPRQKLPEDKKFKKRVEADATAANAALASGDGGSPLLGLGDSEESQAFRAWSSRGGMPTVTAPGSVVARFKAYRPTGAFDSAAVSLRYMPKAQNWGEILGTVGLLYGLFIGLPAISALWSLSVIFGWSLGGIFNWLPWHG